MSKITLPIKRVDYVSAVQPLSYLVGSANDATIPDGTAEVSIECTGLIYNITPAAVNPLLDTTFDCQDADANGVDYQGVITSTVTIIGDFVAFTISENVVTPITITLEGEWAESVTITGTDNVISVSLTLISEEATDSGVTFVPFTGGTEKNWVAWSDIGSLNFTLGKSNVQGKRPLDWKGWVYRVLKLRGKPVVYGENGVSMLIPSGTIFGLTTVYRVGLKGKHAVGGDDTKHFFVDKIGQLWKLADEMKKLGYEEYLSKLSDSIVVSYDALNNLVYICDGTLGYVYNSEDGSLGKCQGNITGITYQSGVLYTTAAGTITTEPFEICTDIYDMGVRGGKTIYSLEFGTDLDIALYAAVDYRRDKSEDFTTTPWYVTNSYGRVFIVAYGGEFRFRARTLTYEQFKLDYIKVNGVANAY
jgi:hypothetical protein